jgi:RHS repeat-associated protein
VWEFLVAVNPFSTKEAQAASLDHIITIATTNIYIGQTYEIVKETHQLPVAKKYIYLGPNRICSVENGEAYYYHTDHLNSSNIITDDTGTQQKRLEYMPYGGTSVESGTYSTNYRFTGKELDDETGLYFYGARYYNPIIGRFITPDSIVQAPQNPQTLNRYSYCVNNPVNYTDPSGHFLFLPARIGALIGGLIGGINAAINGGNFFEGFFGGALVGLGAGFGAFSFASVAWGMGTGAGISAYYGGDPLLGAISGGVGAILGGAIPIHSPNLLAHLAGNALKGAIIGATTSAIMGGDIGLGALAGAGVGAVMGFITSEQFQNAIQGNGFRSSRVDIAEQYEQEINKIHSLNPSASEDIELKIGLRQVAGIAQHEFIQLPDGTIIEMGPNNAGQIQIFKYNVNNEASIQGALSLGNTPIDTLGALRSSTVTWVQTSMSASVLTNSLNSYVGHWGGSIYYPTSYNSNYFVNTVVYGQSGNITGNFGWAPTFAHKY